MPTARELFRRTVGLGDRSAGCRAPERADRAHRRTFLFELLVRGSYDRAESSSMCSRVVAPTPSSPCCRTAQRYRPSGCASTCSRPATFRRGRRRRRSQGRSTAVRSCPSRRGPARRSATRGHGGGRYLWIPFALHRDGTLEPPRCFGICGGLPACHDERFRARDGARGSAASAVSPGAWRLDDPELRLGRAADWRSSPTDPSHPQVRSCLRAMKSSFPCWRCVNS